SLTSRGYVKTQFSWNYYYYSLTNEGIEYLREYLHLPSEIIPVSARRSTGHTPADRRYVCTCRTHTRRQPAQHVPAHHPRETRMPREPTVLLEAQTRVTDVETMAQRRKRAQIQASARDLALDVALLHHSARSVSLAISLHALVTHNRVSLSLS
ncbi:uncharacterized protein L969DRAFT_84779, partial [Mixia osmundae IAM 14324]